MRTQGEGQVYIFFNISYICPFQLVDSHLMIFLLPNIDDDIDIVKKIFDSHGVMVIL